VADPLDDKFYVRNIWQLIDGFQFYAFVQLTDATADKEVLRLLHNMRLARGLSKGIVILRCGDRFWERIATLCLSHADVAVVDVTDLTKNIYFELCAAIESVGPERIILTCAKNEKLDDRLPAATSQELSLIVGADRLAKCLVLTYPGSQGWTGGPGHLYKYKYVYDREATRLTRLIATAIASSQLSSEDRPERSSRK
jgi:hypothetical protein